MTISSDWGIEIRVLSNGTNKDSHSLTKTLIITKIWCFLAGFTRHIHTHMPNWAIVRLRWVTAEQSQLFNCLASVVGFQISWHLQVIHVVCRRHRHRMASSSVEPFCRAIDKTFFFSFFFCLVFAFANFSLNVFALCFSCCFYFLSVQFVVLSPSIVYAENYIETSTSEMSACENVLSFYFRRSTAWKIRIAFSCINIKQSSVTVVFFFYCSLSWMKRRKTQKRTKTHSKHKWKSEFAMKQDNAFESIQWRIKTKWKAMKWWKKKLILWAQQKSFEIRHRPN